MIASSRTFQSRLVAIATIVGQIAVQGCDTITPPPSPIAASSVRQHVTGGARAALKSDNQFQLAGPASLNGDVLITPAQAKRLAMAFLRTYGQAFRPAWEEDRGANIDLARLSPSARVFFAQSPYASLGRRDVHSAYRRDLGPYYVLTFNDGEVPNVVIAVSALVVDYGINARGLLAMPGETGMDFLHEGIPAGAGQFMPLSPEEAAMLAAEATGAKVQSVPELVLAGSEHSPTLARWRVDLDADAEVRTGSGRQISVRTLYVGGQPSARFAIAHANQPASRAIPMLLGNAAGSSGRAVVTVRVHPGRASEFETVQINRQED